MQIEQLIFVGLNGYALALDRDTGEIVWSNGEMKSGYVTFLLDFDRLIVSTNGYIYCLDPLTGKIQWHNPLKGLRRRCSDIPRIRPRSKFANGHRAGRSCCRCSRRSESRRNDLTKNPAIVPLLAFRTAVRNNGQTKSGGAIGEQFDPACLRFCDRRRGGAVLVQPTH